MKRPNIDNPKREGNYCSPEYQEEILKSDTTDQKEALRKPDNAVDN